MVVLQLLDPRIYSPAFREQRVAKTGFDVVTFVKENIWKILALNHVPSVRQYMEIFAIKFILRFPDDTLSDTAFYKTLLDPQ